MESNWSLQCAFKGPHDAHVWTYEPGHNAEASGIEMTCEGVPLTIEIVLPNPEILPVPLSGTAEQAERISIHEQAPPYPVQRPYDWDQHRCARCKDVDRLLSHAAWHEHMLRVHKSGGIPINCEGINCEGAWPVASDEEKRALSDYLRLMLTDTKWDSRALYEELVYLRRKYQHIMDYPKPQPSSAGSPSTRRRD